MAYFGKMDMGHGLHVAIGQIVAEELDVPFKSVKVIMADTATTVNQGGASGSTGIQEGGKQMRMAAAEARRVLVEMAAAKLGVPADKLVVNDGAVSTSDDAAKRVTYAELIGGQYFNVQLDWNKKYGNPLYAPGKAQPKKPSRPQNRRPADQARGRGAQGVRARGLRHRRESAGHGAWAHDPPGGCRRGAGEGGRQRDQVHSGREGRLGQRLPRRGRRQRMGRHPGGGKTQSRMVERAAAVPRAGQALRSHPQGAGAQAAKIEKQNGNVEEAFKTAAKIIEADYEWPFQSHASMGPACALVEIKDGQVTCWSGTQKSHFVQQGLAATLGVPLDKVHVIWAMGPGSYGRNDADDCAMDAAVTGESRRQAGAAAIHARPGHRLGPEGPRLDAQSARGARRLGQGHGLRVLQQGLLAGGRRTPMAAIRGIRWPGQTMGVALKSGDGFGVPAESYAFDNKKLSWETIPPLLDRSSPLRTSHLRDPVGPQIHFASESFIDEVAAAVNADPIEFRLRHIKEPRDVAVIKAAAEKANWQTRPSPRRDQTGNKVSGRGIAYAQRNGTRVAVIAEVDVDRSTGKIWARKFTVAHDCGQIINPDGLTKCIEGNIVQGVSRTLWEEVTFDSKAVTSVDWISYPILDITETPGEHRRGADQPSGHSGRPAPASRRSARWRRRSPTPSSTPPACASGGCRSRPSG